MELPKSPENKTLICPECKRRGEGSVVDKEGICKNLRCDWYGGKVVNKVKHRSAARG